MRRRAGVARAGLVLLLLLAVVGGLGCDEDRTELPPGMENFPEQQTTDYHTRHTKGGVPVWELSGNVAERYPGEPTMNLTGVHMVFFREGARDAVLTSDTGEVDQRTQATVARGNVVVITEEGRKLESEILHWDPERELIHTDAFVRFTDGDQVLTGYGLETDPDLTNVVILRQVEGGFPDESAASGPEGR